MSLHPIADPATIRTESVPAAFGFETLAAMIAVFAGNFFLFHDFLQVARITRCYAF